MTDRDAILEAIFAAPEDDAPRLVYADWLDENGHPEQAEFVRRHIELFRTPIDDFRWRERTAALEACWNRFKIELMETSPHTEVRMDMYSRGLPEHLYSVNAEDFLSDAPGWWPVFPVRRVRLFQWATCVREVCRCPYLTHVTELTLQGGVVDPDVAQALIGAPVLTQLRRLRIWPFPASHAAGRALREHFGDRLHPLS